MVFVMSPIRPSAVLWDFDGTLVDTEEVWVQTEIEVMARYGVAWSYEQGVALCGASGPATMRAMWAEATSQLGEPLDIAPEAFWSQVPDGVLRHLETMGPPWRPGVPELLADLSNRGVPMAVVSSSKNAPAVLEAADLADYFPVIVDGNVAAAEGLPGKPAPDTFLRAAAFFGVDPADAVVVEDAVSGVAAGAAGGFGLVVGVDRGVGAGELTDAGADLVISDLEELTR